MSFMSLGAMDEKLLYEMEMALCLVSAFAIEAEPGQRTIPRTSHRS